MRLRPALPFALAVLCFCRAGALPAFDIIPGSNQFFDKVAEFNRILDPDLDVNALRDQFKALRDEAFTAVSGAPAPQDKIAALNKILLKDRSVSCLSGAWWRDAGLSAVLLRRRGNSLSAATLYYLMGAELRLPIQIVPMPNHYIVRWSDRSTRINIETTDGGKEFSDYDYIYRQGQSHPDDVEALGWSKGLDRNEFFALLAEAAGCQRASQNRLSDAMVFFKQVEEQLPARSDLKLNHLLIQAQSTGERKHFDEIAAFSKKEGLPPGVFVSAMLALANSAASQGGYAAERRFLMMAYARAPRSSELQIMENLAFCHRSLKDYRGAVRYMELALALVPPKSPQMAEMLYELAIMLKNDGDLRSALEALRTALKITPDRWNVRLLEAGYACLNNEREAGLKSFEQIKPPGAKAEPYEVMLAWFYAASRQREKFYAQLENVLSRAASPQILVWLDQDTELNLYRSEPEFQALAEKHRQRLKK